MSSNQSITKERVKEIVGHVLCVRLDSFDDNTPFTELGIVEGDINEIELELAFDFFEVISESEIVKVNNLQTLYEAIKTTGVEVI